MKFIVFFILSISIASASYFSEKVILNGDSFVLYAKLKMCETATQSKCYPYKKEYIVGSLKIEDVTEQVEDMSQPANYSRIEEVESCDNAASCSALMSSKKCSMDDYFAKVSDEGDRVYCVKFLGYPLKTVTRKSVVVDDSLKNQILTKMSEEASQRKQIEETFADIEQGKKVFAMVQLMNKKKGLTQEQRMSFRAASAAIREDLFEGYLSEAKTKIQAMPVSEFITAEDKLAVIKLIDDYLATKQ